MTPANRIALSVSFSVAATLLPLDIVSRLSGEAVPPLYWAFATLCPALISWLVSRRLVAQGEELRRLHSQLELSHAELRHAAETDPLTGLFNRGGFLQRLGTLPAQAQGWLLLLDIDHFKVINDRHGHEAGDAALRAIAGALQQAVRGGDLAGRLGGEEFAVYLPRVDAEQAAQIAERVRLEIERVALADRQGVAIPITASVGYAPHLPGAALDESLRQADRAMYRAKEAGRNRIARAA